MTKILRFPICDICLEKLLFTIKCDPALSVEEKEKIFEDECTEVLKAHKEVVHEGKKSEDIDF